MSIKLKRSSHGPSHRVPRLRPSLVRHLRRLAGGPARPVHRRRGDDDRLRGLPAGQDPRGVLQLHREGPAADDLGGASFAPLPHAVSEGAGCPLPRRAGLTATHQAAESPDVEEVEEEREQARGSVRGAAAASSSAFGHQGGGVTKPPRPSESKVVGVEVPF